MDEGLLPEHIRMKAATAGGEYAWRPSDVEDVIRAGRSIGLACIGSEIQFQLEEGICEPEELGFDSGEPRESEPWQEYVDRAAADMILKFRKRLTETDFVEVAKRWPFLKSKFADKTFNIDDHVWFVLYFNAQ